MQLYYFYAASWNSYVDIFSSLFTFQLYDDKGQEWHLLFFFKKMQYLLYTSKYVKRIDLWISGIVEHRTSLSLQERTSVTLTLLLSFPSYLPQDRGMEAHLCSNLISYFKWQVDTCVWTVVKCVCAKSAEKISKQTNKRRQISCYKTKQNKTKSEPHKRTRESFWRLQ